MHGTQKMGLIMTAAAAVAASACGNKNSSVDNGLARDLAAAGGASSDLQLAPRGGTAQTVVSAIEGGPTAAPTHAVRKPVVKPVTHAAPLRAAPATAAPAPKASVAQAQPAAQSPTPASTPAPAQASRDVPPLPPFPDAQGSGKARQRGTYGTEAEIFQRMPWIRP